MGATEDTFYSLAVSDGYEFTRGVTVRWLSNLGHLNPTIGNDTVTQTLRAVHNQLRGDERVEEVRERRIGHGRFPDRERQRTVHLVELALHRAWCDLVSENVLERARRSAPDRRNQL